MAENPFIQPPILTTAQPTATIDVAAIAKGSPEVLSGARWFWWIAGLSLANTIILHSEGKTNFVVGLGLTLIVDSLLQNLKLLAFAFDAVALGCFVLLGWWAGKGRRWAFVVGGMLYLGDSLIYLYFQEWMCVAFHLFALCFIFRGGYKLHSLIKLAQATPPPAAVPGS